MTFLKPFLEWFSFHFFSAKLPWRVEGGNISGSCLSVLSTGCFCCSLAELRLCVQNSTMERKDICLGLNIARALSDCPQHPKNIPPVFTIIFQQKLYYCLKVDQLIDLNSLIGSLVQPNSLFVDRQDRNSCEQPQSSLLQEVCHRLSLWGGTEAEICLVWPRQVKHAAVRTWLLGRIFLHPGNSKCYYLLSGVPKFLLPKYCWSLANCC